MNKKKVKKYLKINIILLCIVLIIFCMIYFSKRNVAKRKIQKVNDLNPDYSEYVMPLNRRELINNYTGRLSKETIYTLMYEFAIDTLPKLKKENNSNIEKYFNKNSDWIFIKTGIESQEVFVKFLEKI